MSILDETVELELLKLNEQVCLLSESSNSFNLKDAVLEILKKIKEIVEFAIAKILLIFDSDRRFIAKNKRFFLDFKPSAEFSNTEFIVYQQVLDSSYVTKIKLEIGAYMGRMYNISAKLEGEALGQSPGFLNKVAAMALDGAPDIFDTQKLIQVKRKLSPQEVTNIFLNASNLVHSRTTFTALRLSIRKFSLGVEKMISAYQSEMIIYSDKSRNDIRETVKASRELVADASKTIKKILKLTKEIRKHSVQKLIYIRKMHD